VLVIGGGIIGLATAWQLTRSTRHRVVVIEKEPAIARHQTGHNSGVLHSGIYYRPDSLKAQTCRRGKHALEAFCRAEGIAHEICGKVVVAHKPEQVLALERIEERARGNGVQVERIGPERLAELEPAASGVRALWVPETGIVDFVAVCHALARCIIERGGEVRCGNPVVRAFDGSRGRVMVETERNPIEARLVIACAGLQADRVAARLGVVPGIRIVPFRGEYRILNENGRRLVRNLIYPVPDARLPFLGVHFTRRIDGTIDCGPNAVLAMGREAYDREHESLEDWVDTIGYPGFWRFLYRHPGYALDEYWRSLSSRAFARALQCLVPEIVATDLSPGPSGIRAQALTPRGALVDDFVIVERVGRICVLNAPSPAATASLEIGRIIAEKARTHLG